MADRNRDRDEALPVEHVPVLPEPLLEWIQLPTDGIMVDATAGHGGHGRLFGQQLGPAGKLLGIDVDQNSIQRAQSVLSDLSCQVTLVRENFEKIDTVLADRGIDKVDFILADLGFCSAQLTDVDRGLSFQQAMPLDMRLDDRLTTTAADLVNTLDQTELADVIYQYGEDRASRRIARFLVEQRQKKKITTTTELAMLVCRAVKKSPNPRQIHPATRTFQALRIAVNRELACLERFLAVTPDLLKPGGRIAVISFHSLEDRLVKNSFKEHKAEGRYAILTKKPLTADADEMRRNPRSRSAKLRIAKRL
jgi:16S rRNA (cytosine1402-N4)-methyltransferase